MTSGLWRQLLLSGSEAPFPIAASAPPIPVKLAHCIQCALLVAQEFVSSLLQQLVVVIVAAAVGSVMHKRAAAALQEAAAEGLELFPSNGSSGYKGVYPTSPAATSFKAIVTDKDSGKQNLLGCFPTAEEAALCYVRAIKAVPTRWSYEIVLTDKDLGGSRSLGTFPSASAAAQHLVSFDPNEAIVKAATPAAMKAASAKATPKPAAKPAAAKAASPPATAPPQSPELPVAHSIVAVLEHRAPDPDDADVYQAERLVDHRVVNRVVQYRVRWDGCGSDEDTWEPVEHLAPELIEEYNS